MASAVLAHVLYVQVPGVWKAFSSIGPNSNQNCHNNTGVRAAKWLGKESTPFANAQTTAPDFYDSLATKFVLNLHEVEGGMFKTFIHVLIISRNIVVCLLCGLECQE
jgi:hypothetical protein